MRGVRSTSTWTGDVVSVAPLLVAVAILLAGISSVVTLSRYTRV